MYSHLSKEYFEENHYPLIHCEVAIYKTEHVVDGLCSQNQELLKNDTDIPVLQTVEW